MYQLKRKTKWVLLFLLFLLATNGYFSIRDVSAAQDLYTAQDAIPEDAIRLRILANSDSISDQTLKRKIRDAVAADIHEWIKNYETKEEASQVIQDKIPELRQIIETIMEERNQVQPFTIELTQTEFPTKLYGSTLYQAGTYEALKIVLGEGKGANWWCVLFPPLCFLDFSSSSVSEEEETVDQEKQEEVEVKFFLFDLFQ
ncbi:MAG TPA: stage II sporulation protein R [Firmicutes bacterium]|nr:stage II sporulation protein R [Bacillota bacterium]